MCYFITHTLPAETDVAALQPIFSNYGFVYDPIENPFVKAQLPPGELHFRASCQWCDCKSNLTRQHPALSEENREEVIDRLRRKRWSDARIARREANKAQAYRQQTDQELRQWLSFFKEILMTGQTSRIGLLVHLYRGLLTSEKITLLGREIIAIDRLEFATLAGMNHDTLYEFTRTP